MFFLNVENMCFLMNILRSKNAAKPQPGIEFGGTADVHEGTTDLAIILAASAIETRMFWVFVLQCD